MRPMRRGSNPAKGGRTLKIDMTGVESRVLVPEADYPVEVVEVTQATSKSSNSEYLKWKLNITQGEYAGQALYYNTSLQPQALFNLKNVLVCAGIQVPRSIMTLNLDQLIGKKFGVTVIHERYDGKDRAKVDSIFPLHGDEDFRSDDELDAETEADDEELEDEELEETPPPPKKALPKPKPAPAEEEEEDDEAEEDEAEEDDSVREISEEELNDMDLVELLEFANSSGIQVPRDIRKRPSKIRALIVQTLSAEDEEEEDEDI